MSDMYNLYNLEAPFKEYLLAGNQKPISVKNYISDFRHFAGWLLSVGVGLSDPGEEISPLQGSINTKTISEYKSYLSENNIPHKTINRRLSTVRKFCSFCISQGWLKENPAKKVTNITTVIRHPERSRLTGESKDLRNSNDILDQFESDLKKEKLDQSVITSYLEDIQDFLKV